MKKVLVISSVLITLPSFALCPLDISGNTVCSEITTPSNSFIYDNIGNKTSELQPLKQENNFGERTMPNPMNNNSGCPFGICAQENRTPYNNTP